MSRMSYLVFSTYFKPFFGKSSCHVAPPYRTLELFVLGPGPHNRCYCSRHGFSTKLPHPLTISVSQTPGWGQARGSIAARRHYSGCDPKYIRIKAEASARDKPADFP